MLGVSTRMNKSELKNSFRKEALKRLSKKRVNNYKIDKLLTKELFNFIKNIKAKDIMLFIPLKTEPNIVPLIKLLRECGYNLYVPFIIGDRFKLVKYRLPLNKKNFGIKEPNNSYKKVKKIDLAIVPILGIDSTYRRVGFGKGMYDRFYSKYSSKIDKTIFLQRYIYCIDKEITNSYDISADYLFANSIIEIDV
jgi:5-formyltetrahydrofolate cyclo-ligase